jgi:demethylmenaquinone methyltransferase/2-methoxy-6-polyprenyl-1,4-benzoquinol methylase
LRKPDSRLLDLCCGTGDLALALLRWRPNPAEPIIAADFSQQMLLLAQRKFAGKNISTLEADAMRLPFADSSIDLVVCAFGFRNLVNYQAALIELHRVLSPGGQIGILEAAEPEGLLGNLYRIYFHRILPRLGAAISGNAAAYRYLPASVERFPAPPLLLARIRDAGFLAATWTPYTFGVAGLFCATKPYATSSSL